MQAIVLAEGSDATAFAVASLREHHPDAGIVVVQCDPLSTRQRHGADHAVAASSLDVGSLRYSDLRLAGGPDLARWACLPAAVAAGRALMATDGPTLVLPGSAWVQGPLDDLLTTVADDEIGLLPRWVDTTHRIVSTGWIPDVVVVGAGADDALAWWTGVAADALTSDEFLGSDTTDPDPWRTFVGAGGPFRALTDPSVRVSPTSVASLRLDIGDATVTADGSPVRLAVFPGFERTRPWWYSTSPSTTPAVLTSADPALRHLCTGYATALDILLGPVEIPRPGTARSTDNAEHHDAVGVTITPELRAEYRRQLRAFYDGDDPQPTRPPNVYVAEETAAFMDWLRGPGRHDGSGVNLAADLVLDRRPDLRVAFPNMRWSGRGAFVRWLWTSGLKEGLVTAAVLPELPSPPTPAPTIATGSAATAPRFGVNLVGYHDSDLGLGVAVRRVGAALDAAGVPWTKVTYDRTHSHRREAATTNSADAPYWFNLILIAPDQLQFFVDDVGREFLADHHNIGLWYWETNVLSPRQAAALDLVDEIWGSTKYLVDVFAAHTAKPVVHIPVPLEFAHVPPNPADRARLGLDERFTILFTFDFFSIWQRKNPVGLAEAYRRAFSPDDGARLILKSINGHRHVADAEELRAAIADRPDLELWDIHLDASDRLALVANVDCYASLHRSEGLGLTMAEAMAAGTPVVATGFSGNIDFMPPGSALLVDYHEVSIGPGSFYPAHGTWADPDLDHAAMQLRSMFDDAALRSQLRAAGPEALRPFTLKRVGAQMAERLRTTMP